MANQFITVSKLLRQAKIVLDLLYSICLPLWTNTLTIPTAEGNNEREMAGNTYFTADHKNNLVHICR